MREFFGKYLNFAAITLRKC